MQMSINVNSDRAQKRINEIKKRLGNLRKPIDDFGKDAIRLVEENIEQGGQFFGTFKPLAASTIKRRGTARPILNDTGEMLKGFYGKTGNKTWELKNTQKYANYHQTGTRKMPQRLLIKGDKRINNLFIAVINKHFEDLKK